MPDSGTMPLMGECVLSVHVGNVEVQSIPRVSCCRTLTTRLSHIHNVFITNTLLLSLQVEDSDLDSYQVSLNWSGAQNTSPTPAFLMG